MFFILPSLLSLLPVAGVRSVFRQGTRRPRGKSVVVTSLQSISGRKEASNIHEPQPRDPFLRRAKYAAPLSFSCGVSERTQKKVSFASFDRPGGAGG